MPIKKVHVTDHDRRKPHQDQHIHVDDYNRMQEVNPGRPPGASELGPRDDEDLKYPKWNERSEWSLENERECEDCGQVRNMGEMIELPNGDWYCQPCAENLPDEEEEEDDIDQETELIESIQRELGEDTRTCEKCGKEDLSKNMVNLPGGEWLCKSCNAPEPPKRPPETGWKRRGMKLLTKADEKKLPKLYATESIPVEDKVLQVKYFTPTSSWTWYAVEFDGEDTFFGYTEGLEKEWGYFSLKELSEVKGPYGIGVERDKYWTPKKFGDYLGGAS